MILCTCVGTPNPGEAQGKPPYDMGEAQLRTENPHMICLGADFYTALPLQSYIAEGMGGEEIHL